MLVQYLSNPAGEQTAVQISIQDWNEILDEHADIKERVTTSVTKQRLPMSAFKGLLSKERGEALLKYVEESRNEWDRNF